MVDLHEERNLPDPITSAVKTDCRHYRVFVPCTYNKALGNECHSCDRYSQITERILFIKLDAMGDVVRTGSVIPALVRKHPGSLIVWLTLSESGDLVAANRFVDEVILWDWEGMARVMTGAWDYVYCLSNDHRSAAAATLAAACQQTFGFKTDSHGIVQPMNRAAANWLELAAFDRLKKANTRSYLEIMYDMAECQGPIERPPLCLDNQARLNAKAIVGRLPEGIRIGINVGSGRRWPKKMLNASRLVELCDRFVLARKDVVILLLGGPAEAEKIGEVKSKVQFPRGVHDMGTNHTPLKFAALIRLCNALVSGDTLAMHLAVAVNTPCVALCGPTNAQEIDDYNGLVTKIRCPELDCLSCYGDCQKEMNCMSLLDLDCIVQEVLRICDSPHPQDNPAQLRGTE